MGCCASTPQDQPSSSSRSTATNKITKKNVQTRVQNWHSTGIVSLRDCSLTRIPLEPIASLVEMIQTKDNKIKTIDVTNNRIAEIPISVFVDIGKSVQRLILGKNTLKSLDTFFVHLKQLKVLDAHANAIETVDWRLLTKHCTKLKSLNLRGNMLKEVNLEELGKMEMLEDVDVSENGRLDRLGRSAESSSSLTPNATPTATPSEEKDRENEEKWRSLTSFAATKCNLLSIPDSFLPPKIKTILLDDNPRLLGLPRDLFQNCPLLQRVSAHRCPAMESKSIETMNGYSEFLEKVHQSNDKKIKVGVLLGSRYGDDGFDRKMMGDERLDGLKS